ncbi:hypothetical protein CN934_22750 [Ensifer sp. MMN_5]|nr:hypothetical protein CN934_22750 [Ensifer sp. MMN_5]
MPRRANSRSEKEQRDRLRKAKGSLNPDNDLWPSSADCTALRPVEIEYPPPLVEFLIPALVTGIQPDQVLGLEERFPRRRRGAAGSL